MTSATPSSVSASLSRVCDAGSRYSVSSRLSRISACDSFAVPWMTLTRSKTTRRSAPMMRSRFLRPTSKSTNATFLPVLATAAPSAAVEVVLPTPPLPDVTTTTLPIYPASVGVSYVGSGRAGHDGLLHCLFSCMSFSQNRRALLGRHALEQLHAKPVRSLRPGIQPSAERHHAQRIVVEEGLHGLAARDTFHLFRRGVPAVDGEQFGLVLAAEDACRNIAFRAGNRPAAQRAIDMDRASGDDLGPGRDRAQHDDVAMRMENR